MKNLLKSISKLLETFFGVPQVNPSEVSPLTVLIGTVLSQNTNDINTYKAYRQLKEAYPDWRGLISAPLSDIVRIIKPAGLTKQKSEAILEIIHQVYITGTLQITPDTLIDTSNEDILKMLTSIKGVGTKTAACVLLFSLKRNVCPVDTHVHRVLNRVGIVAENTPEKTFYAIEPFIPEGTAHSLHTNLIRLGRTICRPGVIYCGSCPLLEICNFREKNLTDVSTFVDKDFMLLDSL